MTGSGKNVDRINAISGMPLSEVSDGSVMVSDSDHPAFAIAMDGAPPGGIVTYSTDGTVERKDWFLVTGTKHLIPKQAYFLSGIGRLSTSGKQQVGIARSPTELRIQILPPSPAYSQIWPVKGRPSEAVGKTGDLAYDSTLLALYGPKSDYGWGRPAYMIRDVIGAAKPPMLVKTDYGWAPYAT